MKSKKLLQEWLSIIADKKATIKAEPYTMKHTRITDNGEKNSKFIAKLMRDTIDYLESGIWDYHISPYNFAHGEFSDCCGIFDRTDEDNMIICNECGKKLTDVISKLQDNYIEKIKQLQYFKDKTIGLFATDKTAKQIVHSINNDLDISANIDLSFKDQNVINEIIEYRLNEYLFQLK
jgi:hypothetical protein